MQINFYEHLYSSANCDTTFNHMFLEGLPQITKDSIQHLNSEITLTEISEIVSNMKTGKSPGTDGLTVDFYQFFWAELKDLVFNSLKMSVATGILSDEQRRAVLKLIPKKKKISRN